MGSRQFYDQMLLDACQHQQMKITDEIDITTIKEYMQARKNSNCKDSCTKLDNFCYVQCHACLHCAILEFRTPHTNQAIPRVPRYTCINITMILYTAIFLNMWIVVSKLMIFVLLHVYVISPCCSMHQLLMRLQLIWEERITHGES